LAPTNCIITCDVSFRKNFFYLLSGFLLCSLLCLFSLQRLVGGSYQKQADQKRKDVQCDGEKEYILITYGIHLHTIMIDPFTGMIHNKGGHLIAGESRKRPCGERDPVDGADGAHAVMVRQKRRHIGEAAAVSCVYHKDQSQYKEYQKSVSFAVLDAAGEDYKRRADDGKDEDHLVDGISVLHSVCPCGESKSAARVKDCGYSGDHAYKSRKSHTFHDHFLLRDQRQTAGDIDIKHQPDSNVVGDRLCLQHADDAGLGVLSLRLMPALRLLQKQMAHEHHDKVNCRQNDEHLVDAAVSQILQHTLHDRARDRLCRAEARHSQARRQTFSVLKPKHQRLYGREVTGSETDTHDKAVAYIDADERQCAVLVLSAVVDEKSRPRHACRKTDRRDQRGLMDILFHHVPQECRRHTEEKDGKAERPLRSALGEADVISNLLTEDRPTVNRTDAAVQKQRRNRGADPFVGAPASLCFVFTHDSFFLCPLYFSVLDSDYYTPKYFRFQLLLRMFPPNPGMLSLRSNTNVKSSRPEQYNSPHSWLTVPASCRSRLPFPAARYLCPES